LKLAFRLLQGTFNLMRTHRSGEHDFREKAAKGLPLPYQAPNVTVLLIVGSVIFITHRSFLSKILSPPEAAAVLPP
jgi:hypothetical protein